MRKTIIIFTLYEVLFYFFKKYVRRFHFSPPKKFFCRFLTNFPDSGYNSSIKGKISFPYTCPYRESVLRT